MIEGHEPFSRGRDHVQEGAEWLADWQYCAESDFPPHDPNFLQRWQEWSSDSENAATYDRLVSTLRDVKNCARPPMPSEAECSMDEYDGSVPVHEWLASNRHRDRVTPSRQQPSRRRIWLAVGIGTAVAAAIALRVLEWPQQPPADRVSAFETTFGENREVHLPDGSSIILGAKTALTTHYTDRERIMVLNTGESLFHVAHDPRRPFIVLAGRGCIRDVGTSFNVSRDSDRVVVTVVEGTVDVAPRHPSVEDPGANDLGADGSVQWQPMRLIRGQRVSYSKNGEASPIASADLKMTTSWREGRLQYDRENLRHVFADVNRYWNRQIIYDPQTGDLMYTGDVLQDDIDAWVRNLHVIFPVEVVDTDSAHVLVRIHREPAPREPRRDGGPR